MRTILLALTLSLLSCTLALGNIDVNGIFSQWQKNYGSITHLEFAFTDVVTNVVQNEGQNVPLLYDMLTMHTKQASDGKYCSEYTVAMTRGEGESLVRKRKVVFDGTDQYVFELDEGQCPMVWVNDRHLVRGLNIYNELEFYFLTEKEGNPKHNFIESLFPPMAAPGTVRLRAERELVAGRSCVVLERLHPKIPMVVQTVWFAEDAGMLPMKFVWVDNNGDLLEMTEVLEVAQSDGFWYPKHARRTQNYRIEQKSVSHEITVTRCLRNPTYGSDEFKVEIEPGTIVYDDRIKEGYLVGSPDG